MQYENINGCNKKQVSYPRLQISGGNHRNNPYPVRVIVLLLSRMSGCTIKLAFFLSVTDHLILRGHMGALLNTLLSSFPYS